MKSAIRVAYDSLAEIVAKDMVGLNKAAATVPGQGGIHPVGSSPPTPKQEVLDQLNWSTMPEIVKNYEMQIAYNQERLEVARELYQEWLATHNKRRETLIELFRMLPQEEQDEIMLAKLAQ